MSSHFPSYSIVRLPINTVPGEKWQHGAQKEGDKCSHRKKLIGTCSTIDLPFFPSSSSSSSSSSTHSAGGRGKGRKELSWEILLHHQKPSSTVPVFLSSLSPLFFSRMLIIWRANDPLPPPSLQGGNYPSCSLTYWVWFFQLGRIDVMAWRKEGKEGEEGFFFGGGRELKILLAVIFEFFSSDNDFCSLVSATKSLKLSRVLKTNV